ncbi:MAG TPA: hypothetical protein PLC24_12545 [Myxococcota bacterium]|nr:hypothetical protein [Myxococcota bacterium]
MPTMLIDRLERYLSDTLNVIASVDDWEGTVRLPLYLRELYSYRTAEICGTSFLLMIDVDGRVPAPSLVAKHVGVIQAAWGGEVVYVCSQLSAYARRGLIDARIQFVVPGNQLYLPVLAVALRERFSRTPAATHKFSPATQVLVLFWIYNPAGSGPGRSTPTEMARVLGYTKMTMSRAFREVNGVFDELARNKTGGDAISERLTPRELWNMFQSYMRDPVGRHIFLPKRDFDPVIGLRAGLTALAELSMLAEPARGVWAVGQNDWLAFARNGGARLLDRPDADSLEIEIWRYPPKLFGKLGFGGMDGGVDPLSLYLSLREDPDERVQMALDELLGAIRW